MIFSPAQRTGQAQSGAALDREIFPSNGKCCAILFQHCGKM